MGGEAEGQSIQAAMGQIGPLLMGMQAGTLGRAAVARGDRSLRPSDPARRRRPLVRRHPNIESICNDYGFDREDFYRWVAVNEVSRHLCASQRPGSIAITAAC